MSIDVGPLVGEQEVTSIAEDVWSAMVGADEVIVPVQQPLPLDAVSAWVHVEGPWSGAVVLTCGASTAAELTQALVRPRPGEQLDADDVDDALGELANVIGGGIKSLLPAPASLGLPVVGPGTGAPTGTNVVTAHLSWRGNAVSIALRSAALLPASQLPAPAAATPAAPTPARPSAFPQETP